ncbi:hypothetical protein SCHPADRAFT_876192 [Schizopora paradoxa]|uniref:NEDD8-activating enzyme E1 regulatory subunit n=1 Tax=Schizopora paradoxa TaxID=27342 RepID=A0A0H2RIY4_9AGAM|nr:hypothetical protein SCHPADRAFT_876192 [Schizopora paradoxa]
MTSDSQDIESATTAMSPVITDAPDSKTRRYDRQLRLWAASGQSALESSRILVLSGTATSTSILKNLVLPGIGHFTILDDAKVSNEDAGNNFFLEGPESIGKPRASEAVRLLRELNESVDGAAELSDISSAIAKGASYFADYSLVIAHNIPYSQLNQLSEILWSDVTLPHLIIVRSAGFLAEFSIQFHEHTIIESHPEMPPSLRLDKPFPALLEHARSLDFENMDVTDHGHIPYAVILVRAMDDWKAKNGGKAPTTTAERDAFKKSIYAMKKKSDEENFDEAVTQFRRAFVETKVPMDVADLFQDQGLTSLTPQSSPFFHLLAALREFCSRPPHTLPLSAALPDMKADTKNYVHLQKLYKTQSEKEKDEFKEILAQSGIGVAGVEMGMVDDFVKNCHGLRILRGKRWGALDANPTALASALLSSPREAATHLALSSVSVLLEQTPQKAITTEAVTAHVLNLLPKGTELPSEVEEALGEVHVPSHSHLDESADLTVSVRSPTADLPNTAAFLGGIVAQEAIKMITKQYVPVNGICAIDLIGCTTGIVRV